MQLEATAIRYRVNLDQRDDAIVDELLIKVDTIPVALVQAQAAIESGWGTSRFALEANNYFGQWCFEPGCGLVPAHRPKGKTHEVARFSSPYISLEAYMLNLNSFRAYAALRARRAALNNKHEAVTAIQLSETLIHYSERGRPYIDQVQQIIVSNGLE